MKQTPVNKKTARKIVCSRCGEKAEFKKEIASVHSREFSTLIYECPNRCVDHIEVPRLIIG